MSTDYNPPHKDAYEQYDSSGIPPKFINFWIPIDGITQKTSLPIVPESHLIPENKIIRTTSRSSIDGNNYHVRFIKDWGCNKLQRTNINLGQALIFSSYLIHGLATNDESDMTRVALEFRLFRKNTHKM